MIPQEKVFFNSVKRRMPHFFNAVNVLEYVQHNKSKSIKHLFLNSRYTVLDPDSNDLSEIDDNSFNVVLSINHFNKSSNYLQQFQSIHRVSSKFVMFSCLTAGASYGEKSYYKNLTQSDFYNSLDLDLMFETYKFEVDYPHNTMYFWGVKRIDHLDMGKV